MNKIIYASAIALLAFAIPPLKAQVAPLPHLIFHVEMSGSEELPAVNTNGKSLISILYSPDRAKVTVSGLNVHLQGAMTEAKVHLGKTGQTGPAILDLMPVFDGKKFAGDLDVPANLLPALLLDGVYAEIKTTAHPNGEIRGQFICETDLDFGAKLSGGDMVPPSNAPGIIFGGLHYPTGSDDLVYALLIDGLSGDITDAAIYEGAPGTNGVKKIPLTGIFGNLMQGLIGLDTIDPDFLRKARDGKYYLEVKTAAFPNGEVRGQLYFLGYFDSFAPINSVQQIPPAGGSAGFAFSQTMINASLDSLQTIAFVSGITPSSVEVHVANAGSVGPKLVDLNPTATPGIYTKTFPINDASLTDFAQNRMYIQFNTAAHPNGEIRGQWKNSLRKGYAFDLCAAQLVPPGNSNAFGIGVGSVDQANCYINYKLLVDGMSGPPIQAYIAQAPAGSNGNALYAIPNVEPLIADKFEIMTAIGPIIEDFGTYMELRTAAHPSGEVRGQIRRGLSCPEMSGLTVIDEVTEVMVSPVPFNDKIQVRFESRSGFEGRIVLYDMMGAIALTKPLHVVSGLQTVDIQTNQLPIGTYTISLEGEGASKMLKKVVKQK